MDEKYLDPFKSSNDATMNVILPTIDHGGLCRDRSLLTNNQPFEETQQKSVTCPECNRKTTKSLKFHFASKVCRTPCLTCGVLVKNECALKAHMRLHKGVAPFICPDCGKGLSNRRSLARHFLNKCFHLFESSVYLCRVCCSLSKTKEIYSLHLQSHVKTVFECRICNLTCENGQFSPKEHMLSHHIHSTIQANWWALYRVCSLCWVQTHMNNRNHYMTHLKAAKRSLAYNCQDGHIFLLKSDFKDHLAHCKICNNLPEKYMKLRKTSKKHVQNVATREERVAQEPTPSEPYFLETPMAGSTYSDGSSLTIGSEIAIETNTKRFLRNEDFSPIKLSYSRVPDDHKLYCKQSESESGIISELQDQYAKVKVPFVEVVGGRAASIRIKARLKVTLSVLSKKSPSSSTSLLAPCAQSYEDKSCQTSDSRTIVPNSSKNCPYCSVHGPDMTFSPSLGSPFTHEMNFSPLTPRPTVSFVQLPKKNNALPPMPTCLQQSLLKRPLNSYPLKRNIPSLNSAAPAGPTLASIVNKKSLLRLPAKLGGSLVKKKTKLPSPLNLKNDSNAQINKSIDEQRRVKRKIPSSPNVSKNNIEKFPVKKDYEFWDAYYAKLSKIEKLRSKSGQKDEISLVDLQEYSSKRAVKKPKRLVEEKEVGSAIVSPNRKLRSGDSSISHKQKRYTEVVDEDDKSSKVAPKKNCNSQNRENVPIADTPVVKKGDVTNQIEINFIERLVNREGTDETASKRARRLSSKLAYIKNLDEDNDVDFSSGQFISEKDSSGVKNLFCAVCRSSFMGGDQFKEHLMTHRSDGDTHQCWECGECFVVRPSLKKHMQAFHKIKDLDQCFVDNYRERDFVPPTPPQEPLEENQCKVCREVFPSSRDLKKHFRVHGMAFLKEAKKMDSFI